MDLKLKRPQGIGRWLQIYQLYMEAFPASERKPFGMIRRMYRKGTTDIWCLERSGSFAGIGITINGPDLILLDYFAVRKPLRGQGIGAAALDLLREAYRGKGFFLEIESTLEDAPNRQQRLSRKRFYLSCGLEELGARAKLFGVNMELLGNNCTLDYDTYKAFYRDNYNQWAADHIQKAEK